MELVELVGQKLDFPVVISQEVCYFFSSIVEIPVIDAEVAEDLSLQSFNSDLWVSEDHEIVIVGDSLAVRFDFVSLLVPERHQEGVSLLCSLWIEALLTVSSNYPAVDGLGDNDDVHVVIDVLVEIDPVERFVLVDEFCPFQRVQVFLKSLDELISFKLITPFEDIAWSEEMLSKSHPLRTWIFKLFNISLKQNNFVIFNTELSLILRYILLIILKLSL